jgi:NADH:ubiquinone oxidoreductase subunit E
MQIPYIAKMQDKDKDKSLIKELMKINHKYELTKIERTAVLTLNGNIFIPTAKINSVIRCYHEYICHPGATLRAL